MRENRTRILTQKQLFMVIFFLTTVIIYTLIVIICIEYYTGEESLGYSPHPLYPVVVFAPCCLTFLVIVLLGYVAHIIAETKMARKLLSQSPPIFYRPPYQPPYQPSHNSPRQSPYLWSYQPLPLRYRYSEAYPETNTTASRMEETQEETTRCSSCDGRVSKTARCCQTCGETIKQHKSSPNSVTDEE